MLAIPVAIVLVGAWTYRWVQEDAFINFRIIGNLLAGHGPVYNIGERVEVYSDPLWLYLQAGLHEVLPFISLEWMSVVLGLGSTAGGVILAGRAIQRLGGSQGEGLVFPDGLLMFSVVAGVWEFATSGLEMGLVFLWIGLSFWLLVRVECHRESVDLASIRHWTGHPDPARTHPDDRRVPGRPIACRDRTWLAWKRITEETGSEGAGSRPPALPSPMSCSAWRTSGSSCPIRRWPKVLARPGGHRGSPTSGTSSPPTRYGYRSSSALTLVTPALMRWWAHAIDLPWR